MNSSVSQKVLRGASIVFLLGILASILGYFVRLLLARTLTVEEYGFLAAVLALFSLINIFKDLGLNASLTHYVPAWKVKGKDGYIRGAIQYVLRTKMLLALISTAVLFFLKDVLAKHYFDFGGVEIFVILLIHFFALTFIEFCQSLFVSYSRFTPFGIVEPTRNTLFILLFLTMQQVTSALASAALAYAVSTIVVSAGLWIFLRTEIHLHSSAVLPESVKKSLWAFGLPVVLAGAAGRITNLTDTIMLTATTNLSVVGIYNAAVPTAHLLFLFSSALAASLMPSLSALFANKQSRAASQTLRDMLTGVLVLLLPLSIVLCVFNQQILLLLFGNPYVAAAPFLIVLVIGALFFVLSSAYMTCLNAAGRPEKSTIAFWISAIVNVILNVLLIFFFGAIGAAWATAISQFMLWVITGLFVRGITDSFPLPFKLFSIVVSAIIFTALILSFYSVTSGHFVLRFFISAVLAGIPYFILLYVFKVITKEFLSQFIKHFRR